MTYEERRKLCQKRVTLDGKPAVIGGARHRFATVATLPHGASYEWAWETVKKIVEKGGDFRS